MTTSEHLGRQWVHWNEGKVTPCHAGVFDGEEVIAVIGGKARRVTVVCAAGCHARVEWDGGSTWRHVDDLARIKAPDDGE